MAATLARELIQKVRIARRSVKAAIDNLDSQEKELGKLETELIDFIENATPVGLTQNDVEQAFKHSQLDKPPATTPSRNRKKG